MRFHLLLAASATLITAAAPVIVAPADPTALFQGDGNPIKFDPGCRDFTLTALAAAPACAARVADGELGPSIAIAARTLGEERARAADAILVVERALAKHDHPAAHYLLGSALATGEALRPDYVRAVHHLSVAAARGNPAAADLLARLLMDGRGAPRDVPRAVRLYEQAAANGFPSAAVALAMLHLQGRFVPRDDEKGRALLDAAVAAGFGQAAQLQALAQGMGKVKNFQLIPAVEESKVRAVSYGQFDNPSIPPNFGFDEPFQQLYFAPFSDPTLLKQLQATIGPRPTPYLYELARRLAPSDPDRALETYLLARLRMSYDALRCADPAALEAVRAWDSLILPDLRYTLRGGDKALIGAAARRALAAETHLSGDLAPWWVCRSGMAAMQAAMEGKPGPLKLKPAPEWPALRAQARAALEQIAERR